MLFEDDNLEWSNIGVSRPNENFDFFHCGCLTCKIWEVTYAQRIRVGTCLKQHLAFTDLADLRDYALSKNSKPLDQILSDPTTVTCPASLHFYTVDAHAVIIPIMMLKQTQFSKYFSPRLSMELPTTIPLTLRQCNIFDRIIHKMNYFGSQREIIKIQFDDDLQSLFGFFNDIGQQYIIPYVRGLDVIAPKVTVITDEQTPQMMELPAEEIHDAMFNYLRPPAKLLYSRMLLTPAVGMSWSNGYSGYVIYDLNTKQFRNFVTIDYRITTVYVPGMYERSVFYLETPGD